MKFPDFKNIHFSFGFRQYFASSPERYWGKILLIFLILLILVLIFDGWVFLKFSVQAVDEKVLESRGNAEIIKKSTITNVLDHIQEKQKKFIEAKGSAVVQPAQKQ